MKFMYMSVLLALVFISCNNEGSENTEQLNDNTNKIVVEEVLQTSNYTYLTGNVNGTQEWLAVSKMNANKGDTYYYEGGMLMENFVSKELNRTFEKIWFLDNISTSPQKNTTMTTDSEVPQQGMKPNIEKGEYTIQAIEDGITIAELFSNKTKYSGKTIKVKGIVTKVNAQIMERNWIHIQDGTDHEGEYDLTITSQTTPQEGDTITVEGKVSLDKDFGYGYAYKVIIEDAEIIK